MAAGSFLPLRMPFFLRPRRPQLSEISRIAEKRLKVQRLDVAGEIKAALGTEPMSRLAQWPGVERTTTYTIGPLSEHRRRRIKWRSSRSAAVAEMALGRLQKQRRRKRASAQNHGVDFWGSTSALAGHGCGFLSRTAQRIAHFR